MRRSLVVLALLIGCRREPSSDAAKPSTSVTASAASSHASASATASASAGSALAPASSDAPAPGPRVRLVVRKPSPTARAQAAVTAPELGLDETVGELVEPHTCRATRRGRSLGVSCTPGYRTDRLVITEDASGLLVERPGGKRNVLPVSAGTSVTLLEGEVSARDVTPCAPGGPPRTVEVSVQSHWDMDEGSFLRLVLGAAGPTVVELFRDRHRGQLRCTVADAGERRTLTCDGRPSRCELWLADGEVRFRCDAPEPREGSLLLPCGGIGRFASQSVLSQTVHYY